MARNPSAVQSKCSWRAGEPNTFYPSQICFHIPAKLGTPSTTSHELEPQQLSPGMKRGFQAAWCCRALSPSQDVQSASVLSLVSQNALSREVRGSSAGGVILIPSLPDQFEMTFLLLSWKWCLESQKKEYVAFSCCQVWGGERPILPSPNSQWEKRCEI